MLRQNSLVAAARNGKSLFAETSRRHSASRHFLAAHARSVAFQAAGSQYSSSFRSRRARRQRCYVQSAIPILWNCMARLCGLGRVHIQTLALISFYAPVVIIILAVLVVLFSFFWVFLPLPPRMSKAVGQLLVRFWRWRERERQR